MAFDSKNRCMQKTCLLAFFVKMCLEWPAGHDKHEIKNKFSAEYGQSKARPFQSFRLIYSSQMAVAPQGTTPPVADTGKPISSQLVFPPKRGTSVVLSIYSMTAGDRPVV